MTRLFQLTILALLVLGCTSKNTDDVSFSSGTAKVESGEDYFTLSIERLSDGKTFETTRTGPQESVFASFANQEDDQGVKFRHVHLSFPVGLKNFKIAFHGDQPGNYSIGEVRGIYKSHINISQMLDGEFASLEAKEATINIIKIKSKEGKVTQATLGVTDGYVDMEGSFEGVFTDGKQDYQVSGTFKTWNNLTD